MEYLPYRYDFSTVSLIGFSVIGLIVVAMAIFAIRTRRAFAPFMVATYLIAGTFLVMSLFAHDQDSAERNKWRASVASELSDAYGIELTAADVADLKYPAKEPAKRLKYWGSADISPDGKPESLLSLKLATEGKKVYLLSQVGAEYEKLPTATEKAAESAAKK